MTHFCAIAPTPLLNEFVAGRPHHLVLAHLIEEDKNYTEFYRNESRNGSKIIMDNSAFEMYKQNKSMYSASKLLEMAKRVEAHYIVLPDKPADDPELTISAAKEWAPVFKEAGFGTFFCPQTKVPHARLGDKWVKATLEQLNHGLTFAVESDLIDYIGISILNVPNAYGVEKSQLQRFLSRWHLLRDENFLIRAKAAGKLIHFLGMLDGPNEGLLVENLLPYIDTWDSSGPIWAGLHGVGYDSSPTGQHLGKFEEEVDFNFYTGNQVYTDLAKQNLRYLDGILHTR